MRGFRGGLLSICAGVAVVAAAAGTAVGAHGGPHFRVDDLPQAGSDTACRTTGTAGATRLECRWGGWVPPGVQRRCADRGGAAVAVHVLRGTGGPVSTARCTDGAPTTGRVLHQGQTWRSRGYTCTVRRNAPALECTARSGHGFVINLAADTARRIIPTRT